MTPLLLGRMNSLHLSLKLVETAGKVSPLFADVLYRTSKSVIGLSTHTTYTLFPEIAISGLADVVALPLKFFITAGNVLPLSRDFCRGYQSFQVYHPPIPHAHYYLIRLLMD